MLKRFRCIIFTYMYLRETRQKRADGSTVTHLQLAESVWNPHQKRSEVRILYNCGRAEDPKTAERLKKTCPEHPQKM